MSEAEQQQVDVEETTTALSSLALFNPADIDEDVLGIVSVSTSPSSPSETSSSFSTSDSLAQQLQEQIENLLER